MTSPAIPVSEPKAAAADQIASSPPKLTILCDSCHKDVGALADALSQRKFKKGFVEIGLRCPHCGFWIHSYYTNPELEQARQILANFKAHAGRSPQDRRQYEQKLTEFQRKHRKVQQQAKKLVGASGS